MHRVSLCLSLVLLWLCGTGCLGPVKGLYPPAAGETAYDLTIVNNHWHTGLILPRSMLTPTLLAYVEREAAAPFIEIGWGDDGFYRSDKVTSGLALQAVFFSRGSVLHVVAIPSTPEEHYRDYDVTLHPIRISQAGRDRLMEYLEKAFKTDDRGRSVWLQVGQTPKVSSFYRARGRYAGWHTCNHWTADAIRTTGFPITPLYSFTANNVGWQIERAR